MKKKRAAGTRKGGFEVLLFSSRISLFSRREERREAKTDQRAEQEKEKVGDGGRAMRNREVVHAC